MHLTGLIGAKWIVRGLLAAAALLLTSVPVLAADLDENASATRVFELTNIERAKAGVPPLALSGELTNAAQTYSTVLAESGCFAHTCGPVPDFSVRITQSGYTGMLAAGENLAAGYRTPEEVIAGWLNSPGHRANLLSANYTEIGIGVATGEGRYGIFWAQEFGARLAVPDQDAADAD
jgi:uncharacterized protein YkwD